MTSSRFMSGGIYESEPQRLQREADDITKKYEYERKRLLIYEDKYKQALQKKMEKEEAVNTEEMSTENFAKTKKQIRILENQLEKEVTKYNRVRSKNNASKKQIDVMRKELKTAKQVQAGLQKDMAKIRKKIRQEATKNNEMQQETEELHNEILALKQKDQDDKTSFEDKMRDLKKKLSDTDTSSQRLGRSMMQDNASTMAQGAQTSEEFSNPADLLKDRLVKWVKNNKEKKHLMDKYIRNVKVIEDAFEQIREAEGIPTVQEIVSTFVKSEEQNYHMTNYLNTLNSEIDTIQEQNRKIQAEIEKHEKIQKLSEDEKQAQIE